MSSTASKVYENEEVDERKTVALFIRDFRGGGAERAMINLANGLLSYGFNVDLVVLRDKGSFRSYLSPEVRVVDLRSVSTGLFTALGIRNLIRYLIHRKPAKLISTLEALTILAFIASSLLGRRNDLVIRIATTFDQEPRPFVRGLLISMVYRLHGGMFVTNSRGSKKKLEESLGIRGDRIEVIYNSVDLKAIETMATRELEHGALNSDRGFFLFVGRLSPAKRVDLLIRAFSLIHDRVGADLVILGEGPLSEQLAGLIKTLELSERICMPGFTFNPYAYMNRAAAFVLPSDYEGMPTVLIEAMACGCPVVSTDCPSGPREILENGKWGTLVPVGDSDRLAEAMEQTLQKSVKGKKLKKRARRFSVERTANKYVEVLFEVDMR